VIYATPPCVITRRSPVQGSRAVPEHLCLTRPYVPKARTLGVGQLAEMVHDREEDFLLAVGFDQRFVAGRELISAEVIRVLQSMTDGAAGLATIPRA
jgi:hypothetical protein